MQKTPPLPPSRPAASRSGRSARTGRNHTPQAAVLTHHLEATARVAARHAPRRVGALWRRADASGVLPTRDLPAPPTELALPCPRPARDDLAALDVALCAATTAWPRDATGRLDLALLRRPINLYLPLRFADDTCVSLATLLHWHRTAYLALPPAHRRPRGEVPIDARSQDYLLWALRHATADTQLATTSSHREPTREVVVACSPVAAWTNLQSTRRVMRAVLTQLSPLAGADVQDYWLVIPRQGRVRLSYFLRDYWNAFRRRGIANGTLAPAITKEAIKESALDIIYYDLFAAPRPHPRWQKTPATFDTLAWPRGQLVPTAETWAGALATATAIARTPHAATWTALPRDRNGTLVFVWPTGEVVRYRWFLHQLHVHLLAAARANPALAARFFNPMPPPTALAYAAPTLFTRAALHTALRHLDPTALLANPQLIVPIRSAPRPDGAQVLHTDPNGGKVLVRRRAP